MKYLVTTFSFLISALFSFIVNGQSPLKDFSVQDINGTTKQIDEVIKHDSDKIVLLYTWFPSNCGPCIKIMDFYLTEYYDKHKKELGIKFIALNIMKKDIPMAKKIINGELYDFQLKRAEHYFDAEEGYNASFKNKSVPQLYIIVNGEVIYYENGFYTDMGKTEYNANHIKDVVESFHADVRYYDQYGRICKEKKNIKDDKNVEPSFKEEYIQKDNKYEYRKSNLNGILSETGFTKNKYSRKKMNWWTTFHDDGKSKMIVSYYNQNGELDSIFTQYYKNSNVFTKQQYKNNKLWNVIELKDKNQNDLEIGSFKNGSGNLFLYDEEGNIRQSLEFKEGVLNGVLRNYVNKIAVDSLYYINGVQSSFPDKTYNHEVNEGEIFKSTEIMPRFPGCEEMAGTEKEKSECAKMKLLEYIYKNLKYPEVARANGLEGSCVAQFVIDKEGKIDDINIVRDIDGVFGAAVIDVLESMNTKEIRWSPGLQKGRPVRVLFTLPVRFSLDGSNTSFTEEKNLIQSFANYRFPSEYPREGIDCKEINDKKRCVSPEIKESNYHFYCVESLGDSIAFKISRHNSPLVYEQHSVLFRRLKKPIQDLEIELINGEIIKSKIESNHNSFRQIIGTMVSFTNYYFVIDKQYIDMITRFPVKTITFGMYEGDEMDKANTWKPDQKTSVQISKWIKELRSLNH